jgi:Holliday junction DNA helicase RuvB
MGVRVHHITAYALNKPAEIISLLNSLQKNDILFIDELHRLKPIIEEVLYVAMEDFSIDMLMPDGKPLRLTLHPFTLIGATTKPEALSTPLKNRFVYKLHFQEYSNEEKEEILTFHCNRLAIILEDTQLSQRICSYVTAVPREIGNLSTQLHDWLIAHYGMHDRLVSYIRREQFRQDLQLQQ